MLNEIGVCVFEIIDLEDNDSPVAFLRGSGLRGSADRGGEIVGLEQFSYILDKELRYTLHLLYSFIFAFTWRKEGI